MNHLQRLVSLKETLEKALMPYRPESCCLVLSTSIGIERAVVNHWLAPTFDEAWERVASHLLSAGMASDLDKTHIRVDCLTNIRQTTWGELKANLAKTKRNYFREGLLLDAEYRYVFLETELNANAMLLSASDLETAQLNAENFNRYARKKFGARFALDHAESVRVWLFTTAGAYLGPLLENAVFLQSVGLGTGLRHLLPLDAESTHGLIQSASEFLARQVKPSGEFVYGLFPCFDREIASYNCLRHASSTYAMIEAWEVTQSPVLKAAIDRALNYLTRELIKQVNLPNLPPGNELAFLLDTGNEIKLGGNAVCILALCKYTEVTGDRQYMKLMGQLAHGMAAMFNVQSGQFVHVLNYPELSIKEVFRIIYYDGEAAFALMRLYRLTGNPAYLQIVQRAFDYFIEARHDKSHDHWLSYCVNELTMHQPLRKYFEFGIRNFNDYLNFVLERITTFPTLLELMMAAEQMLQRMQQDSSLHDLLELVDLDKFYRALNSRANQLLNGFFWPELAMFYANPQRIQNGFFIRHHAFRVRIDDVEHYLSGLVAYRKFLKERKPVVLPPSNDSKRSRLKVRIELPNACKDNVNGELPNELLHPIRGGILLAPAAHAWNLMRAAALKEGIVLLPLSAGDTYRPLPLQVSLFKKRYSPCLATTPNAVFWAGQHWLLQSGQSEVAVPGTSPHGWGIAIAVVFDRHGRTQGWLLSNASRFGFSFEQGSKPWLLIYRGADWARIDDTEASWAARAISKATPGSWTVPPSKDWRASGISAWHGSFQPGNAVVVAERPSDRGLQPAQIENLPVKPAALLTTMPLQQIALFPWATGLPVYQVDSNTQAILDLAHFARQQFTGKVIGVTGTAGKTTTVHMLAAALSALGKQVPCSRGNANLPYGVAWNLCQMDWAAPFSVLELAIGSMGLNTRMARPDVAIVTNIGPARLEYHGSTRNVALKKSAIFHGVPDGGAAVICHDTEHADLLIDQAKAQRLCLYTYGEHQLANVRLVNWEPVSGLASIETPNDCFNLELKGQGKHMVFNAMACIATAMALDLPVRLLLRAIEQFTPVEGRGQSFDTTVNGKRLTVIDESYNANPVSMAAAIENLNVAFQQGGFQRKVMVLGDMLELGENAGVFHADLAGLVVAQRPDLLVLCGALMRHLADGLKPDPACELEVLENVSAVTRRLPYLLKDGDLVLVKSSHGTGLHHVVAGMRNGVTL